MMNVVSLESYRERDHLAGQARCVACGHEWEAVAPTGTVYLDCAECGGQKGIFARPTVPKETDLMWSCKCGGEAFYLIKNSSGTELQCWNCGDRQKF